MARVRDLLIFLAVIIIGLVVKLYLEVNIQIIAPRRVTNLNASMTVSHQLVVPRGQ